MDLHVAVQPVPWRELQSPNIPGIEEGSVAVRRRVERARVVQTERLEQLGVEARINATVPVEALDAVVLASPDARDLLGRAVDRIGLSARAAHRTMRVARTIADLAGEHRVGETQMAEAIGFRS